MEHFYSQIHEVDGGQRKSDCQCMLFGTNLVDVLSITYRSPLAFLNCVRAFLTCTDENNIASKTLEHFLCLWGTVCKWKECGIKGGKSLHSDLCQNQMARE